ncbi:four helix bundle protein [uncultured Nostoc sp.]|uniref:four helix bundle protein n=1 Tax=uncultured Nostoc sp. TaxID=340711 RepID=UPI0035CC3416
MYNDVISPNFLLQTCCAMSYREQFIWQRGVKLAINCYRLTEKFPKSELYGLTSQIRRSAVSVPSTRKAEGRRQEVTASCLLPSAATSQGARV